MIKLSKRHLAKTITWRLIATLDTIILSWLIVDDLSIAFKIGSFELITKVLLLNPLVCCASSSTVRLTSPVSVKMSPMVSSAISFARNPA